MTKGAEDEVSLCASIGSLFPWLTEDAEDDVSLCASIGSLPPTPCSIITDGDLAMRNAITRVMLGVFHRLCA
ncbi:hypothetical protein JHK82_034000 [Glycine max]|nr:hypothetical protein JHK82_034000 [Glycine max]